ncbi:MAG TPA: glycogen synthase GlgA [Verrucomicrobiae bacterium]|nr:glycogen synthase GlgA [Verrucomicrobiae bacterium]
MKIAMIASEVSPFAKTGGLADVIGTLSVALERLGHEICVIAPAYRCVLQSEFALRESPIKLSVPVSNRQQEATVLQSTLGNGVLVYLIRADRYFDRESLYGTATGDYPDNAERFVFFSRAALELLRHQRVDVVHCHDWQTALAIVFLKTQTSRYLEMAGAKSVFTLHNLGFQGIFQPHDWHLLNLDAALSTPQLEFYGNINFLKGALVLADKITTVSPSYAQEIMTAAQGFGLEGVVRQRAADLVGILNGVDYSLWNPWTDPFITPHYGEKSLPLKDECKRKLRRIFKLPDNNHSPVIGMISRLTAQKGFDLVEAIFDLLMQRDVQFILLGTGETRFEQFFGGAVTRYADRVGVRIGFDESLAHQIEAGADLFLMPSLYEPCGLNQMFSLKYGTIPIVRAVGGLKDTVQQCDTDAETGTGFVFEPYEAQALLDAIDRSLQVFHNQRAWTALRRRAMAMDFSWERSAKRYVDLYRQLVN